MSGKKIAIFCVIALWVILSGTVGYHSYCHYMVSKYYKCVDEGDTAEILSCIEKMPDVNMYDVCIPIYKIRSIALGGAADKGYPLYYAVWKQADISVMEALLEKGADVNKEDYDLPLQCLLRYEQEDMYEKAKLFVKYGADINVGFVSIPADLEQWPEDEKEERMNTITYLWECGIDEWEYVDTKYERTILHDAAERMEVQYLEALYENEKRPMYGLLNEKDANGETPLFYAVRAHKLSNCVFLINEGADINIRNSEGKTAYDVAEELGYKDCMELLGAETNESEVINTNLSENPYFFHKLIVYFLPIFNTLMLRR